MRLVGMEGISNVLVFAEGVTAEGGGAMGSAKSVVHGEEMERDVRSMGNEEVVSSDVEEGVSVMRSAGFL